VTLVGATVVLATDSKARTPAEPQTTATKRARDINHWQTEDGVKKDHAYFTVANRCQGTVELKVSYKSSGGEFKDQSDGRKTLYEMEKNYSFRSRKANGAIAEFDALALDSISSRGPSGTPNGKAVVWLRKSGGDWKQGIELDYGRTYRLEVKSDCKSITVRKDDTSVWGCYKWRYLDCGRKTSDVAPKPAECQPANFTPDGGVLKACEFTAPNGSQCKVYYDGLGSTCDLREQSEQTASELKDRPTLDRSVKVPKGKWYVTVKNPKCSKTGYVGYKDVKGLGQQTLAIDPMMKKDYFGDKPPVYLFYSLDRVHLNKTPLWDLPEGAYEFEVTPDCKTLELKREAYPEGAQHRAKRL
jgi:hypothetical protein